MILISSFIFLVIFIVSAQPYSNTFCFTACPSFTFFTPLVFFNILVSHTMLVLYLQDRYKITDRRNISLFTIQTALSPQFSPHSVTDTETRSVSLSIIPLEFLWVSSVTCTLLTNFTHMLVGLGCTVSVSLK